jgi:hypothetical protein
LKKSILKKYGKVTSERNCRDVPLAKIKMIEEKDYRKYSCKYQFFGFTYEHR